MEHLTEKGVMDPRLLYDSPFVDIAPSGPEQVFELPVAHRLVETIEQVNKSAIARLGVATRRRPGKKWNAIIGPWPVPNHY